MCREVPAKTQPTASITQQKLGVDKLTQHFNSSPKLLGKQRIGESQFPEC